MDSNTDRPQRATRQPGELLSDAAWALAFRVLEPSADAPKRLLILLHGFGADELQMLDAGRGVDADTLVVLPRAPRTVSGGRFGWYRQRFDEAGPHALGDEAAESICRLVEFIRQLQQRHAVPPARTVLAGFSQGGELAAGVALGSPGEVAGVALIAARVMPREDAGRPLARHGDTLHALVVHGRRDETLPLRWADAAQRRLAAAGADCEERVHDAGHELVDGMVADVRQWFLDRARPWNGERPDAPATGFSAR